MAEVTGSSDAIGPLDAFRIARFVGLRSFARQLDATGVSAAIALARNVLEPPVYVTVDVDVLDPAFAPGTGTPEAGGLTSRELLAIVRGLAGLDVVAADVVEVSPPYDPAGATAVAAANVAYDLIGLMALAAVTERG